MIEDEGCRLDAGGGCSAGPGRGSIHSENPGNRLFSY